MTFVVFTGHTGRFIHESKISESKIYFFVALFNGGSFYAVDILKRVSWAEVCNSFILEGFQIRMKLNFNFAAKLG